MLDCLLVTEYARSVSSSETYINAIDWHGVPLASLWGLVSPCVVRECQLDL